MPVMEEGDKQKGDLKNVRTNKLEATNTNPPLNREMENVEQKTIPSDPQELPNENEPLTIANLNTVIQDAFSKFHAKIDKTITDKLKKSIDPLSKKVSSLLDKHNKLSDRVTIVEKLITPESLAPKLSNNICDEIIERNKRACNVIVYNFREYNDPKTDLTKINDFIKSKIPEVSPAVFAKRLGKTTNDKIRPLKLFFDLVADANVILRSKKKIIEASGLKIDNDLTQMQRDYLTDLRTTLNTRIAGGEKDLTIRYVRGNPTIVKREQKNE